MKSIKIRLGGRESTSFNAATPSAASVMDMEGNSDCKYSFTICLKESLSSTTSVLNTIFCLPDLRKQGRDDVSSLPCGNLRLSGYESAQIYVSINPYAKNYTLL